MTALAMIQAEESAALPIGAVAPTVEGLNGTDGGVHGFTDLEAAAAIVVVFSSNRCPTAKAYDARMAALQRDYAGRGVLLLAINSNDPHLHPDESRERMIERAADGGFTYPYVVDADQSVARAFGAECTFHAFLLDGTRTLRYRGRFDDSRIEERVTSHDLRDALDDVLAGRPVRTPTTRPFGCALELVR
jgi:hypothetical protein